jgi:hypothetical protein
VVIVFEVAGGFPRARPGSPPPATAHGREIFRCNPHRLDGRSLFYAPSIGTDPGFADVIIEQTKLAAKS